MLAGTEQAMGLMLHALSTPRLALRPIAKYKAGRQMNFTSYCGNLSCGVYSMGRHMSVADALLQQQQPPGDKSDLPHTLCMTSVICMAVSRGSHVWDSAQFI